MGTSGKRKTTLAYLIARTTKAQFLKLSAVDSGIKDLRVIITQAEEMQAQDKKTILFIDEIHRWNKSQQDALLPHVESGLITLIGATTENPSFEVNSALLSRVTVFVLKQLESGQIVQILENGIRQLNQPHPLIFAEPDALQATPGFLRETHGLH